MMYETRRYSDQGDFIQASIARFASYAEANEYALDDEWMWGVIVAEVGSPIVSPLVNP